VEYSQTGSTRWLRQSLNTCLGSHVPCYQWYLDSDFIPSNIFIDHWVANVASPLLTSN